MGGSWSKHREKERKRMEGIEIVTEAYEYFNQEAERKPREEPDGVRPVTENATLRLERKRREKEERMRQVAEYVRLHAQRNGRDEADRVRQATENARIEAEWKQREAEWKQRNAVEIARLRVEMKRREEADRVRQATENARIEAERKQREAVENARIRVERKRREEADRMRQITEYVRLHAQRNGRDEADRMRQATENARIEAERKQREAVENARIRVERERREEYVRLHAERKRREEATENDKLQAERKRREEANRVFQATAKARRLEAHRKQIEEAIENARLQRIKAKTVLLRRLQKHKVTRNLDLLNDFGKAFDLAPLNNYPDNPYTEQELSDRSEDYIRASIVFKSGNKPNFTISKIIKVDNVFHVLQYNLMKDKYQNWYEESSLSEMLMFHGTKKEFLDSICTYNFDRSKVRNHRFGRGISFARDSYFATHYHQDNKEKYHKVMIITKMFWGGLDLGTEDMIIPSGSRYTSANFEKTVLVKFDDASYYPLYIVYYDGLHSTKDHDSCSD